MIPLRELTASFFLSLKYSTARRRSKRITVDRMNIEQMRYTPQAMAAFKASEHYHDVDHHSCNFCNSKGLAHETKADAYSTRRWFQASDETQILTPSKLPPTERNIGEFPLTSELSPWVTKAMATFDPGSELLNRVKPFSQKLHNAIEAERRTSTGLHDLNLIELTYQYVFAFACRGYRQLIGIITELRSKLL